MTMQVIDLSHALTAGMHTHPGLPGPQCEPYKSRQEYQEASGTTFQIDRICMAGNTGTCLDSHVTASRQRTGSRSGQPALVGIDAVNIDDLADHSRPVHSGLLGENSLILEHLTGLCAVPARGARLHAAPLAWHGVGTWPVRAHALVSA